MAPERHAEDRWMPSGEAARLLGVSTETVRRWVVSGILEGFREARSQRHRYFVSREAVQRRLTNREVGAAPGLRAELEQLRARVDALQGAGNAQAHEEVARERDAYRAENAALKEVLLRLNAAMERMEEASEAQSAALREQREAISVLLTPHSPAG